MKLAIKAALITTAAVKQIRLRTRRDPSMQTRMNRYVAWHIDTSPSHITTQLPPPYTPPPFPASMSAPIPSSSSAAQSPPAPPTLQPTNNLHIIRTNSAIRESILLDLSLSPVPGYTSDNHNLAFESRNGSVRAEVWVREGRASDTTGGPAPDRARMRFTSQNGAVSAQIVSLGLPLTSARFLVTHVSLPLQHQTESTDLRPRLSLHLNSQNGSTTLALPRTFRGTLTLASVHGSIRLSDALSSHTALLREEQGVRVVFVGERRQAGAGDMKDETDDAYVGTRNGAVRVSFDDEDAGGLRGESVGASISGAWSSFMKAFTG